MRYVGPGWRLIGAISLLVPWSKRSEWVQEWHAELAGSVERRTARGTPSWLVGLSLRARCMGAVADAWWLRRQNRGHSFFGTDVRLALRGIGRRPGFSAAVVLTLSLGIGGTTAIFSIIDPLLLRPLPYPEIQRLTEIYTVHPGGNAYAGVYPDVWREMRDALVPRVFDRFEAGAPRTVVVTGAGEPEEVNANALTASALTLLGARPVMGRLFTEDDASPAAPDVVLLGERFWRDSMAGDRGVIGRTITLDGRPFTVIGVLPASFKYPMGFVNLWFPLKSESPVFPVRGFEALARLSEGMSVEAAQVQVDALAARIGDAGIPEPFLWDLSVRPLESWLARGLRSALGLLAGAVACVLLIACVNAANLLLVRSTSRQTELDVRRSLGATGGRLFRQLVTESLVLALIGGVFGVLLAIAGVRVMVRLLPDLLIDYTQATVAVDARVLGFSVLLSLLTGVAFGAGPALRAARTHLVRASERTMTASPAVQRIGGMLVIAELALSMMLLVGAGLLARSFLHLVAVQPGFQTRDLMVLEINLPLHRYPDDARANTFYASLKERLLAVAGVQGVTVSDGVPPRPGGFRSGLTLETSDGEKQSIGDLRLPYVVVDDDYFDVLRIPILNGRAFGPEDTPASPRSAIIDPDLADLLWPNRPALGQRFRIDPEEPWLTVVGIAGDVKLMGPDDRDAPYELYYSAAQETPWRYRHVAVRADPNTSVATLARDIRSTVRALDPEQPILAVVSAEYRFGGALARQRFVLTLMGIFTTIALLLAAIGVYGVTSYLVAQRTREIGLRIALGASPRSIVSTVVRRGLALASIGATIGAASALVLSRFLTSLLFAVQPADATTLALVGAVLGATTTAATLVPALRAGRISPQQAFHID